MPTLITGDKLTSDNRRAVLASYVWRWTHENLATATAAYSKLKGGPPTMQPVSDAQWLREHAFYVNKDGSLNRRRRYAEPRWMVDR